MRILRIYRDEIAAILLLSCCGVFANAQTSTGIEEKLPSWQVAAGEHAQFEVASIHLAEPGTFLMPNMPLNGEDTPVPAGGLFVADFPVQIFIEFAYKIMPTHEQEETMLARLPRWVATDHFVIRAQFTGNPTKDQIRLMMQSLLADRFKLAVHFENKILPVFGLELDKTGKLGPRIRPHRDGRACNAALSVPADPASTDVPPGEFVPLCGRVQAIDGPHQTIIVGARDLSLDHLAGYLPDFEDLGRPIMDQTGLKGTFDLSLAWSRDLNAASATPEGESVDSRGPSFIGALKDQLGLKLVPTRAPVQTLVIDRVELPTPN